MFSMKFNDLMFTRPPCREARTIESVEYFDTLAVLGCIVGRSIDRRAGAGPQKTAADRAPRHICTAHEPQHVASLQRFGPLARVLLIYKPSAAQPHLWEASEPGQQTEEMPGPE